MDLKTMRSELQRLSELVAGWDAPGDISPLERDLALEKLRKLYEALRFGVEAPAADDAAPVAVPLSIDLDEVFLSDPVSEGVPATEPEAAPAGVSEPEHQAEDEAEPITDPVFDPMPEPESEPEADNVFEELTVPTLPAEESLPASESEPQSALLLEPEEPEAEPQSEPEPVPEIQPAAESAPAPESPESASEKPEPVPQPVIPTLFDLEAETVRHRHKQRVIMSLYDTEPVERACKPEPKPAPEPAPQPEAVPIPTPTVPEPSIPDIIGTEASADRKSEAENTPATASRSAEEKPAQSAAGTLSEPDEAPFAEPAETLSEATASPQPKSAEAVAGTVLGEVINHDVQTLADVLSAPRDVASELRRSEPVTDLRRAVGINDKFLLIRDLFDGDGAAYEITIRRLNEFDNIDDCMIYIAENFAWNPNSDGAKLLMELLERKFS